MADEVMLPAAGEAEEQPKVTNGVEHEAGEEVDLLEETGSDAGGSREERVVVKFLVPNVAAGSIIGKSGANITEIQTQSNARMQLSRANEFYPGSPEGQDRILLVSGTVNQLLTALHLVLSKLKAESENPDYHLLTDANLSYSTRYSPGASPPPQQYTPAPPAHMAGLGGGGGLGGNAPHMLHLGPGAGAPLPRGGGGGGGGGGAGASVTIAVPEDKVGVVIGKQGAVINQIKELLGVSIRISKKGEFLPGSHDRACSITGTPEAVEIAQRLIQQKIDAANVA
ncbi:hypothetical protein CHLNCDRAFT_31755 [Chlorella variabilis]|uniref:K Homology domain-containing protein n=1 Tax=Chlorella variabilis TaxID=554065 RepID=E1ZIQ4_CHLVA|nr:hypothetical protein CHLNCDRAFT_31755 [Chlorella variabilis]EFN54199.1 hypothetical protein CHLNCDRAFT_31755 [Chlorella variabilis]|eukprot:XP_005846301.1 hypothetical protein CHLNCDRAFT_31755 [Chlorella variabilis]